jgi:hypothetical protein
MSENEIGYRGSKSANKAVKEQRVDGSWSKNLILLRCTLLDLLIYFQFRRHYCGSLQTGPAQISSYNQIFKSFFSSPTLETILLHSWFITRITHAEGCFTISIGKDNRSKTG